MKTSSFLFSILLLLAVAAQAQTTRTWVGTTNDWGTASNWSPSGVPSSSDKVKITGTGLAPVLGANRTVARLYVDSDSLAMGGYTLTVSGTVTMSNGTVTGSGKIDQVAGSSDSTRYVSSQVNCKVVGKSGRIIATSSVFADSTRFARHLGTVKSECGGNTFHGSVEIENSDNYAFYFGVVLPDTFFNTVTVRNFSIGRLGLCHSSTGNYIAGGWLLNLSTDANSSITLFNSSTTFSTATLTGPLHLGASGGLEIKTIGSGGQLTLTASGTLKIDTMGFAAGTLILANVQQENTSATSFTGMAAGSEVRINMGTTLLGKVSGTGFRKFNVDGANLLGGVDISAEQTVLNDSHFEGNVSLTRSTAAAPVNLYLGGNYFGDDFTFRHASGAAETHWGHSAPDTVMGNLSIANESTNRAMFGRTYASLVYGDVTLQADSGRIYMGDNASSSVTLCGTADQTWTTNTTDFSLEYIKRIIINKPSGRVILDGQMEVRTLLALTSGIVEAKNDAFVKLRDGATLTGVSNASFVEGAVVAQGDTAFTFPIGANGRYRPLSISAPALATAEFKATYYNVNSDEFYTHSQRDSTIGDISRNEVWLLERLTTSNTVSVTLSWDTASSCAFDTLANLKVVSRDTTSAGLWKDLGNGGTTGNVNAGTVVTASAATGYWAFALGSSDTMHCNQCYAARHFESATDTSRTIELQTPTAVWFSFDASEVGALAYVPTLDRNVVSMSIYESCTDTVPVSVPQSFDADSLSAVEAVIGLTPNARYFMRVELADTASSAFDVRLKRFGVPVPDCTVTECQLVRNGDFSWLGTEANATFFSSPFLDGQVRCGWECAWGTPAINLNPVSGPTNFPLVHARMALTNQTVDGLEGEGIFIPLTAPLILNDEYTISFRYRTPTPMLTSFSWGFSDNPNGGDCPPTQRSTFTIPADFMCPNPVTLPPSATWTTYTLTFNVSGALAGLEGLENLMFFPTNTPLNVPIRWLEIDDVSLVPVVCCDAIVAADQVPNGATFPFGTTPTGIAAGVTTNAITDETFMVNGIWTINQNLTLSNCDIRMEPNAQILVTNNAILTITDATHIRACDDMWRGIQLDQGCAITVINESVIEDAIHALHMIGGVTYKVEDATFNRNLFHMFFITPGNPATGSIINSDFICQNDPSAPNERVLRAPYTDYRSFCGIYCNIGMNLSVGASTLGNTFRNSNIGIYNIRAELTSASNDFWNIINDDNCLVPECGTAILTNLSASVSVTYDNFFNSCRTGIYSINDIGDVTVDDNAFFPVTNGIIIQGRPGSNYRHINIFDNSIIASNLGCHIWRNPNNTITIENNLVNVSTLNLTDLTCGIRVKEIIPSQGNRMRIEANEVNGARFGIQAQNINNNADVNTDGIRENTVTMPNIAGNGISGIAVTGSQTPMVFGNQLSTASNSNNSNKSGIFMSGNSDMRPWCNTVTNMTFGLHFQGANQGEIVRNEMNSTRAGMTLNTGTLNQIGMNGLPFDNQWVTGALFDTYALNSNGPDLFFRSAGGNYQPVDNLALINGTPEPTSEFVPYSSSGTFGDICTSFSGVQGLISTGDVKAMLKATLADTAEQPYYNEELKWATKANIYTLLHQADSLMSGDTVLTAFYDSCWSANMGKLYRASEVAAFPMVMGVAGKYVPLSIGVLEDYIDTLEGMTASIIPEDAFRDVLVIEFEKHLDTTEVVDSLQLMVLESLEFLFPDSTFATPMKKNEAYTETQLTAISSIAEECPSEFGNAVYIARAMLSSFDTVPYHYEHDCEIAYLPPSERRGENEVQVPLVNGNFKIYPNPANELLNIEMNFQPEDNAVIELYTLTGAKVKMASLKSWRTIVDVSECPSGIYFFRISINDSPRFFGKQVIVK